MSMQFHSVRDFRTTPKIVYESLEKGEVVLTNNGRPAILMMNIQDGNFEEVWQDLRQIRAMRAVRNMRERAAAAGYMTDEEINAEIAAARKEMRDAGRA